MKIFRGEEEILLEKIEAKSKRRLSEDEDNLKLGEIRIKDSKYFYKPNLREQLNMSNFKIISVLGRGCFGKVMLVQKNGTR